MGLLALKNFKKSISKMSKCFHGVQPCVMAGNFAPNFSLNFLCISQASLGWALWSGYYWKNLFHLEKLSIDDANFGQKWWRQKWNAKAHHGLHRSQWVKVELQKTILVKKVYNYMDTSDIEFVWPWAVCIFFSQSWSDCFAERFVSKIWSMLDNECH